MKACLLFYQDIIPVKSRMLMLEKFRYDGESKIDLSTVRTKPKKDEVNKDEILAKTAENQLKIQQLQDRLYADSKEGLIIIFQARDAAGKDSTIKHVMSGVNPQGVDVWSFKSPSQEDLSHDYLWRFAKAVPARGKIAIFNRSYYEDVLIVKVRSLYKNYRVPERAKNEDIFEQRYDQIRNYEKYLYQNGYRVLKFFLNVSAKEQKKRFLERINQPEKNWKFSESDVAERGLWNQYTEAYESCINNTASKKAPWYVIPADQKWYSRYLVSEAILQVLEEIDPKYPALSQEKKEGLALYKKALEQEGSKPDSDDFQISSQERTAVERELEGK